jgi:hypothetical protein
MLRAWRWWVIVDTVAIGTEPIIEFVPWWQDANKSNDRTQFMGGQDIRGSGHRSLAVCNNAKQFSVADLSLVCGHGKLTGTNGERSRSQAISATIESMTSSTEGVIDFLASVDVGPGESGQLLEVSEQGSDLGLGVGQRGRVDRDQERFARQNPCDEFSVAVGSEQLRVLAQILRFGCQELREWPIASPLPAMTVRTMAEIEHLTLSQSAW